MLCPARPAAAGSASGLRPAHPPWGVGRKELGSLPADDASELRSETVSPPGISLQANRGGLPSDRQSRQKKAPRRPAEDYAKATPGALRARESIPAELGGPGHACHFVEERAESISPPELRRDSPAIVTIRAPSEFTPGSRLRIRHRGFVAIQMHDLAPSWQCNSVHSGFIVRKTTTTYVIAQQWVSLRLRRAASAYLGH